MIYPLDTEVRLKIKVDKLKLFEMEENIWERLKDLYCIINYNRQKLNTSTKPCLNNECSWNQQLQTLEVPA
jgi:hypothetical protein